VIRYLLIHGSFFDLLLIANVNIANWFDHSRDLLHMINHFRDSMLQPIMGIAHSMGCAQL